MKVLNLLIGIAILFASCDNGNDDAEEPTPQDRRTVLKDSLDGFFLQPNLNQRTVFSNVSVISMTTDGVQANQDVFVSNGNIEGIVPTGSQDLTGYEVVDGTSKFLMPGMADMHTHPAASGNMPYDMFLFLANGVTTTRVMWGAGQHLTIRNQIKSRRLVGPTMYVASAGFDGLNTTWPGAINTNSVEDVKSQIDRLSSSGYDFIKVYSGINATQYAELIEYASNKGIPPIGHVPTTVDIGDAISELQSISHLGKFLSSSVPADELYARLAQSNTAICPTMTVINRIQGLKDTYKNEWYDLLSPVAITIFNQTESTLLSTDSWYRTINAVLRKVHQSGATIISGTDTGIRLVLPGISLHEELGYYVFAGMSNYEALKTTTVNPATFLEDDNAGTIEVGKKADIVLLDANPLEDISNVSAISGVMRQGQWIPKDQIDQVLAWIKEFYGR